MKLKIGFYGLSHLGLVTLVSLANKGIPVFGYDPNVEHVNRINSNNLIFEEPDLLDSYLASKKNIIISSDLKILKQCDVVYFSFDVETNSKGISNLRKTNRQIEKLLENLNPEQLLVILSQVNPGFTRNIARKHNNTCYQVETLIFGEALARASKPERIIVGVQDGQNIPDIYSKFLKKFKCPVLKMNYESAEFTKIAINMYLVSDITLTNAMSKIVYSFGANWNDIKRGLQLDKRIGKFAYLQPGLGISGGNLDRDLRTWQTLCKPYDQGKSLFKVYRNQSTIQKYEFISQIREIQKKYNYSIAILGLAYKQDTNSLKNAISLEIYNIFKKNVKKIFDPLVKNFPSATKETLAISIEECIRSSKLLIILNPSREFYGIEEIINHSKIRIILDPFAVLNPKYLKNQNHIIFNRKKF